MVTKTDRFIAAVVLAGFITAAPVVFAEPSAEERADALFAEAKVLAKAGNWTSACRKLEESGALAKKMVTIYRLAECYEHLGRTASAYGKYREAAVEAEKAGESDKQKDALAYAAKLEPSVPQITVRLLSADGVSAAATRVSLDGVALATPELGVAQPVDPGEHVVEATASGKKSYRRTVTLDATTLRLTVDIPALESVDATAAKSQTAEPNTNAVDGGGPDRRTIALGVGAAGVLALGVGVTLTFVARAHYAAADDHCPQNLCDAEGLDASVGARRLMRASTITAGVGLVLVGVGAALWFTAPPRSETAASTGTARGVRAVGLTPFGFVVAGAF